MVCPEGVLALPHHRRKLEQTRALIEGADRNGHFAAPWPKAMGLNRYDVR